MTETLFLRLEGPLQAWGERGRWSVRDTAPEPTKSGVIGLLACALGIGADTPVRELSAALHMGVRADRRGTRLTDYHTIGGGADAPMLLTAEGKPKISSGSPHTEISLRDYLCDASFLVALQATPELIQRLAFAVQNPVWTIFLGRKSCPPSRPVFDGTAVYPDLALALSAHEWPERAEQLPALIECSPDADGAVRRRHHLAARSHRVYQPCYTRTVLLKPANGLQEVS